MKNNSCLVFFVIGALLFSTNLLAAVNQARSIIYFDQNNRLIGQQNISCANKTEHAGDVTPSNPYRVEQVFGCGNPNNVKCHTDTNGLRWCTYGEDWSTSIVYFKSATGITEVQYCKGQGFNPLTEFVGSNPCELPEPAEATSLGPFVVGWD